MVSKNLELSSTQIDAACGRDTCGVPNLDLDALELSSSEVQALEVLSGEEQQPKAPRESLMDKLLGGFRPAAPQAEAEV